LLGVRETKSGNASVAEEDCVDIARRRLEAAVKAVDLVDEGFDLTRGGSAIQREIRFLLAATVHFVLHPGEGPD
jgi:hypothetical protein